MARKSFESIGGVPAAIMRGEHDEDLDYISQACSARLKTRFRKGSKVRLVGTRNVEIEGKIGTVIKVNPKRIAVGLGDPDLSFGTRNPYYPEGSYNVPPSMLEAV